MQIAKRLGVLLTFMQGLAGTTMLAAQDAQLKVDINAHDSGPIFYQTWWFWVLVGLFALIVIIAITSRGKTVVRG